MKSIHEKILTSEKFSAYPVSLEESYLQPSVTFNFVNFHNRFVMNDNNGLEFQSEYWHDQFHYPLNIYVAGGSNTVQNLIRIESKTDYITGSNANLLMDAFVSNLIGISENSFCLSN